MVYPKGKKLSAQQVEKLRQVHLRNKYTLGRHHTPEEKEKIRQSMLGHTISEETRRRMRTGQLKRYHKIN